MEINRDIAKSGVQKDILLENKSIQVNDVTPRFPKYAKVETRWESAMHIRKKNTSLIRTKPLVTQNKLQI